MKFSRSDVVDIIFNTLDWDRARGGHTVDSLEVVFRALGFKFYSGSAFRLVLVELLKAGQLDMSPDGRLFMPENPPDPIIEQYQGAWYVTTEKGRVMGPYSEKDAKDVCNTLYPKR